VIRAATGPDDRSPQWEEDVNAAPAHPGGEQSGSASPSRVFASRVETAALEDRGGIGGQESDGV
jgi:hypothetical protein